MCASIPRTQISTVISASDVISKGRTRQDFAVRILRPMSVWGSAGWSTADSTQNILSCNVHLFPYQFQEDSKKFDVKGRNSWGAQSKALHPGGEWLSSSQLDLRGSQWLSGLMAHIHIGMLVLNPMDSAVTNPELWWTIPPSPRFHASIQYEDHGFWGSVSEKRMWKAESRCQSVAKQRALSENRWLYLTPSWSSCSLLNSKFREVPRHTLR